MMLREEGTLGKGKVSLMKVLGLLYLATVAITTFTVVVFVNSRADLNRGHLVLTSAISLLIPILVLVFIFRHHRLSPVDDVTGNAEEEAFAGVSTSDAELPLLADISSERDDVGEVMRGIVETLQSSACSDMSSVDEISAFLARLDESIESIAGDADELLCSTETASSATQEISSTIREVAVTTNSLDGAADTIHLATNQIATSLKQVTANLVLLSELTASAGSSAGNINSAIKDISDHAQDQASIARDVKDTAATTGLEAVDSTKQGMERIRQEVFTTNASIESLASRSHEIDQIVGVIKDVADETNLLALNAAILAAQAGAEGKAFGIIAEKVRALARRSTESTKAIGEIIHQVQRDISSAGKAVKRSIFEVDNGVIVSKAAETALTEIVTKAETSLEMSLKVESSILLQSKNVELNASAIQNIKKMSADIEKAVKKQSQSAEEIARGVKELRSGTSFVKQTIAEQATTSESIAEVVNEVFSRAQVIATGTKNQSHLTDEIVVSLKTMRDRSESAILLCHDLEGIISGGADTNGGDDNADEACAFSASTDILPSSPSDIQLPHPVS